MFGVLKKYNLFLNLNKCAFSISSDKFLNFIIRQWGIEANPEKIQVLVNMQVLKTQKDIQSQTVSVATLARFISKVIDWCTPFFKARKFTKWYITWTAEFDREF